MKPCIESALERRLQRLPEKSRQWVWFALLWCSGLMTLTAISYLIKWAMGV
jgi:hypothetical protein